MVMALNMLAPSLLAQIMTMHSCELKPTSRGACGGSLDYHTGACSYCRRYSVAWTSHLTRKWCLQIWKYQHWFRTMLLGVLQELQATEKPIIAIHVKAHGTTPVQVSLPAQC